MGIKILNISDTHGLHDKMTQDIIDMGFGIDIIIHAGDMSNMGRTYEVEAFLKWYDSLPFKYKILIAGNHDWLFEQNPKLAREMVEKYPSIIYLENEEVIIDGIKIYGAPQQPEFFQWAFNVQRGPEIRKIWDKIPDDTNILITHGPSYGYGDYVGINPYNPDPNAGCKDLLDRVNELKELKYAIAGHLHQGWGILNHKDGKNITFVNAAMLDDDYRYTHKPIIIEI